MNSRCALSMAFVGLIFLSPLQTKGDAQTQAQEADRADTPARITADHDDGGQVRPRRYNNEGYVIMGYQASTVRSEKNGCSSRSA